MDSAETFNEAEQEMKKGKLTGYNRVTDTLKEQKAKVESLEQSLSRTIDIMSNYRRVSNQAANRMWSELEDKLKYLYECIFVYKTTDLSFWISLTCVFHIILINE